jgi:hypothetical protein
MFSTMCHINIGVRRATSGSVGGLGQPAQAAYSAERDKPWLGAHCEESCVRKTSHRGCLRRPLVVGVLCALTASFVSSCGIHHSSQSASEPPLGYRSLPSFLPSGTPVDSVVTASPSHPQLAVQGVGVRVVLPRGHARMTITGPRVPPFTAPPPPNVTATFTVTFTHVSGTLPVRLPGFTITDQLGRTFQPSLPVGAKALARSISTGHGLTFKLTAVMPTGEGRIYWSPRRHTPMVGWDFIVEND